VQFDKTLKLCSLILFLCLMASAQGASFIFTPLDKQFRDSDAAILGTVKNWTTKKDPRGQVITRYSLSLSWAAGLDRNQDVHPESFHVNVPGGPWQGISYKVSGAPSFQEGEEVFLLLKKSKFGHVVLNLSLGKYGVYKKGQDILLKSSVFPDHPAFHEIGLNEVKDMAKAHFITATSYKDGYQSNTTNRKRITVESTTQKSGRKIASAPREQRVGQHRSSMFWPFLVLVFIAISRKLFRVRSR